MLSWDDFRYVRAISAGGSLSAAASALAVNHSTVFRRLAHIEQQLGLRLFERSRTGYELTPCGEEMVRLAGKMADEIVAFERKVTGHDLRPSGELRVTTNDTLLIHLLSEVFAAFRHAYPEIQVDVVVANEALNLSKRDADIAIRATDKPPDALIGRRLSGVAWATYGRHNDEPSGAERARQDRDWVGFGENLAGLRPAKWLRDQVDPARIVYRVNTVLGLAEAVAAGIGLGLLPCFIGEANSKLTRLTAPIADLETGLWILTHADLRQTARVRAFMDFTAGEITKRRKLLEALG